MNDLSESGSSSEDEDDSTIPSLPLSKSVPDFKEAAARARFLRRSAINGKRLTPGQLLLSKDSNHRVHSRL